MRANFEQDSYYPVRTYRVGDKYVAACNGVERVATGRDGHNDDRDLLKRAERITDAIFADREGGFDLVDGEGWTGLPARGYVVSYAGYECQFNPIDGRYGEVYAAVVDLLESIDCIDADGRAIGVGWWTSNGCTFLDVSTVIADRDEALAFAERADQIAIYDIAAGSDIDIRYA